MPRHQEHCVNGDQVTKGEVYRRTAALNPLLTVRQIQDKVQREYGFRCTPSYVRKALANAGIRLPRYAKTTTSSAAPLIAPAGKIGNGNIGDGIVHLKQAISILGVQGCNSVLALLEGK